MRKINLIVIHCSATKLSQNFTPDDLEACHKARGYKCCGYPWVKKACPCFDVKAEGYNDLPPLALEQ